MHSADITTLLQAWREGDRDAERALIAGIYPLLREIAQTQLRRVSAGHSTLQATELAHEAYERLQRQQAVTWESRGHFFAVVATMIRRILIDHLRRRSSEKRGGDVQTVVMDQNLAEELAQSGTGMDWLALDQALAKLEQLEPASAKVVEMRVFTGLEMSEVASALDISTATVGRHWRFARAFLADQLSA